MRMRMVTLRHPLIITMDPLLILMEGRPLTTIIMDLLLRLLTTITAPLRLILDLLLLITILILMESMV